jgi:hypothetical protein
MFGITFLFVKRRRYPRELLQLRVNKELPEESLPSLELKIDPLRSIKFIGRIFYLVPK